MDEERMIEKKWIPFTEYFKSTLRLLEISYCNIIESIRIDNLIRVTIKGK